MFAESDPDPTGNGGTWGTRRKKIPGLASAGKFGIRVESKG
jgi:hypothetical protein